MHAHVSIIIPCYNEAEHLERSFEQLLAVTSVMKYSFEYIFVDDCSSDHTRGIIERICSELPSAKRILHATNTGRGGAVESGLQLAAGTYAGFLDIDLEVSPVYLIDVLGELERGADVVTVRRHYEITLSPVFVLRHLLSAGYKQLVKLFLELPCNDTESGFKFFRRDAVMRITGITENKRWFWDTEIIALAWLHGLTIREVPGFFIRRKDKTSTVRLVRDTIEYFTELLRFRNRLKRMTADRTTAP